MDISHKVKDNHAIILIQSTDPEKLVKKESLGRGNRKVLEVGGNKMRDRVGQVMEGKSTERETGNGGGILGSDRTLVQWKIPEPYKNDPS